MGGDTIVLIELDRNDDL